MHKKLALILLVVIFLLLFKLFSSEGGLAAYWQLSEALETLKAENRQQAEENLQLKRKVYSLQHNPEAIETLARQKLGMIGEDEVFIQVIQQPDLKAKSMSSMPVEEELTQPTKPLTQ